MISVNSPSGRIGYHGDALAGAARRRVGSSLRMQRILAPTDFSTRSQLALRRAGRLARQSAAELTLVHVVDDDMDQRFVELERREAERFLREQAEAVAELRDLRCRTVVTTGEAFHGILDTAKGAAADLIVMGAHRKQLLRDVFIGTTIERVIRTGTCPVLMVNTAPERPYERVLVAVDLSDPSAHAIKAAQALGLLGDSHVTLVHAFAAPAKGSLHIAGAPDDQIAKYVAGERNQASEDLFAFLAKHQIHPKEWSYRIEEGGAFEVISRVAGETAPDLLVIGTRGRTGIAKMLLGSVAEEVLRSIDVDILAVPPRQ
jgi:nucleotide-binding universal stress UspA family protein